MTASVVLFDGRSAAPDPTWKIRLEAARRRTGFVRGLRRTLASSIVLLGGAVGFFIALSAINPPPPIDSSQVGGQVRMVNPRFTGRDSGGTPFVISARSAERPETGSPITELLAPQFDFSVKDSPASMVRSDRGVFDQEARTLDLLDGVRFSTDSGYLFESEHARVFVDEGRVVGERVVMGEGPLGSIRAQSFEIREGGDIVVFTGSVIARLYPDRPINAEPEYGDDLTTVGPLAPASGADETTAESGGAPADVPPDEDAPATNPVQPSETPETP
jgi:lipopolysaccharide export system protein LptC